MIVDTLACLLLILGVALGLSRPVVDRLGLDPAESLVAGAAFSLIGAWGIAWAVFTGGAPLGAYWLVPAAAAAGALAGRRGLARLAADPAARDLAAGQLIVTGWCVAWLSFVRNHSGGAWLGDWLEHWQRAHFFLREWPAGQAVLRHLPAARPSAPRERPDGGVHADDAGGLRALPGDHGGPLQPRLPAGRPPRRPLRGPEGGADRRGPPDGEPPLRRRTPPTRGPSSRPPSSSSPGSISSCGARRRRGAPGRAAVVCAVCLGGAVVTHYSAGPYVVVIAAAVDRHRLAAGLGRLRYPAHDPRAISAGAPASSPRGSPGRSPTGTAGPAPSSPTPASAMARASTRATPWSKMALNLRDT
jgi:hypothetical protein